MRYVLRRNAINIPRIVRGGENRMNTEKAIEVLKSHKSHWERLLRDKICDKTEGTDFINAIDIAIEALEEQRHIELAQDVWDNTPMDEAGDMW